jgi:hypothetical protein
MAEPNTQQQANGHQVSCLPPPKKYMPGKEHKNLRKNELKSVPNNGIL